MPNAVAVVLLRSDAYDVLADDGCIGAFLVLHMQELPLCFVTLAQAQRNLTKTARRPSRGKAN